MSKNLQGRRAFIVTVGAVALNVELASSRCLAQNLQNPQSLIGGHSDQNNNGQALKAAWIYVTPIMPLGWTHQQELGRMAVQEALGSLVRTSYVASVPEGPDADRVLRDLISQGCRIIFTTSFGYMDPVLRVAREAPNTKFECLTGTKRSTNVSTANARYYQGRFLSGIAAARMSTSNQFGYVASYPIPEVIQGINAFTLGVRSVNPRATVKVIWLQSWFDPTREREAAMVLINQGVDVLSFHTASTAVMVAAQDRGKLAIGYHSDMSSVAPQAQILAITHHWSGYESARVKALLDGSWRSIDTWGGVREGMIAVEGFGSRVPNSVRAEILALHRKMGLGLLEPFTGPIYDTKGQLRIADKQIAHDEEILKMNYLVEGVVGAVTI